jgi:hypothetical protein
MLPGLSRRTLVGNAEVTGMHELIEFTKDFNVNVTCCVLCVVSCALLARLRGHSALFYGSLGLFLSFGAIPLTRLATREPRCQEEEDPRGLGFTPVAELREASDDADLASWRRLYRAIRDSLIFAVLALAVVVAFGLNWAVLTILPPFVSLYEGMSLALPRSTQVIIGLTKFAHNPDYLPLIWIVKFCWPAALFWVLRRSGYKFPLLGGVWKAVDRLWQIQATRKHAENWVLHVPEECARRLAACPDIALPEDEGEYQNLLRRQREALQASLWSLLPALIPTLGLALGIVWIISVAVFLPLYQLIGNLS